MNINRVIPFLWLKNESLEELEKELQQMYTMGLTAFMVESRVCEDFCDTGWFKKMDRIMAFAHDHNMQVWLLDDKSYPTGFANGHLKACGLEKSWRVKAVRTDIAGLRKDVRVRIALDKRFDEEFLGVYFAKRTENYTVLEEVRDVACCMHGAYVYLDVPEGYYSVITVVKTTAYYERDGYIDMMNPQSVRVLIDTVYEPHYQRYKEYFGNTFCGFFSDEPRLNCASYHPGAYANAYEGKIGRYGIAYPWNEQLQNELGVGPELLALWFDIGAHTADMRCRYAELVTSIYAKNFVTQLGNWCREREVLYTGHIIEDMNAHTSLCYSAGHYFKAMQGADLASVDVVLHQIRSLENDGAHMASLCSGYADADFFNYTLMKLASSDAHLDERKQGRALCELFGAYGWAETTGEMLYQVNHCLVRGINHFIPHAFTSEFDNKDCPPHFYAGGLNPANKGYSVLFSYMNRLSALFDGGKAIVDVAVLYHAQAEWSGGYFDACDVVAKDLMQNQIDFDFVDFDALQRGAVQNSGLHIGANHYKLLVVPYYEKLPQVYRDVLEKYAGVTIFAPKGGKGIGKHIKEMQGYGYEPYPDLRVLRYRQADAYHVMFFNEGSREITVTPQAYCKDFVCGNYINNYMTGIYEKNSRFVLKPLEAVVCSAEPVGIETICMPMRGVDPPADIYLRSYNQAHYAFYKHVDSPFFDISHYEEQPEFAGTVRIVPEMDWNHVKTVEVHYEAEYCTLHIGDKEYPSIGGKLVCNIESGEGKAEAYLEMGCSLANILQDDFSTCSYISPCKLKAIKIAQ